MWDIIKTAIPMKWEHHKEKKQRRNKNIQRNNQ